MVTPEKTPSSPATIQDVRNVMRGWVRGIATFLAILTAAVAFTYYTTTHEATESRSTLRASGKVALVTGCNRDFRTQNAFVDLLERLNNASSAQYRAGKITLDQRLAGRAFYRVEIAKAKELVPDCRVAENTLTDDPNAPIPRIPPLYTK